MCIPSEHSLCLLCFSSRERIFAERYLKSLKKIQNNLRVQGKDGKSIHKLEKYSLSIILGLKIRAGSRSSWALSLFSIFHSLADTNRRIITCKEGDLGFWVELEGQEMGKPQPFQEMAFRTAFPGKCPENQKKSNFVDVQLRQNTAAKVLLLGRLFLALPVSWKILRAPFDKIECFS